MEEIIGSSQKRDNRSFHSQLIGIFLELNRWATRSYLFSEPNIVAIGWVGAAGFPLYYLVWAYLYPQPYENLLLRLVGMLLFVGLSISERWPARLRRWLPLYWFNAIFWALAFFFPFMLFKNQGNLVWLMSTLAAVFLLAALLDWLSLVFAAVGGSLLAYGAYILSTPNPALAPLNPVAMPIFLFALVTSGVINYRAEFIKRERMRAALAISRYIAHELRTPLMAIRLGAEGLRHHLSALTEGYQAAKSAGLPVTTIRSGQFSEIVPTLERLIAETNHSESVIEMLLLTTSGAKQAREALCETIRVSDCVQKALERFPFRSESEAARVRWLGGKNFSILGSEVLMLHVLFNLIKNGLHAIGKKGEGEIDIWTEVTPYMNRIHVRDTGVGIPAKNIAHVFEPFFSAGTAGGIGLGLAFCRMAVTGMNGHLTCDSAPGMFTLFTIEFRRQA